MEKTSSKAKTFNYQDSIFILSNKPHPFLKKTSVPKFTPQPRLHYQKFAMFDMDFTLIRTKSGKNYAQDENDWTLLYPNVPEVLRTFHEKGFKVVIVTNQKLFSKDPEYKQEIILKVHMLFEVFRIPLDVFILSNDDEFRKSSPGFVYFLMTHMYPAVHFDFENSFYCGDAAGRPKTKLRKKDFANT